MKIFWEMSDFEISREFRLAKDPDIMLEVLAGLNAVSRRIMRKKLVALGLVPAVRQGGGARKHWTREEDRLLEHCLLGGASFAATAARIPGRTEKSVRHRWTRLQQREPASRREAV